ncbi:MAG: hypothetical protein MJ093_08080 [Saccharofermentans sp.]|nr:hypothetical protein [Saccharofermentans sp.]
MNESFQQMVNRDRGIYVVCSDKELLDKINRMLKRQGIVGMTDGEGKLHYMVDARSSPGSAARQLNEIISSAQNSAIVGDDAYIPEEVASAILDETIESVFGFYEFDSSLIGVKIMHFIVRYMLLRGTGYRNMKELYLAAGWEMHLSYAQIERNVRYAISKSKFKGMKVKTINILQLLMDAVKLGIKNKHLSIKE